MGWEILLWFVAAYVAGGLLCLTTLTRDEYRRIRLKNPGQPKAQARSEAATQGWGNSVFWPVYLLMHVSERALERDAKVDEIDQRTKQILEEIRNPLSWEEQLHRAEKDTQKKTFLNGEEK